MNLIEAIQAECARCRALLPHYKAIGPAGVFGHFLVSRDIAEGESAIASGDVARMIVALDTLRGCE